MKTYTKAEIKLKNLYSRANTLHNIAWEARHELNKVVNKMVFKCKTKDQWDKLRLRLTILLRSDPVLNNPAPRRNSSHSGDIDIFGFYVYQLINKNGW